LEEEEEEQEEEEEKKKKKVSFTGLSYLQYQGFSKKTRIWNTVKTTFLYDVSISRFLYLKLQKVDKRDGTRHKNTEL